MIHGFLLTSMALWSAICVGQDRQLPLTIESIQQLLYRGDIANAKPLLSQALKESPNNGGLYDLQGVIKAQENDFPSAEANFRKALDLDPHLVGTYLNLGHLYQERISSDLTARDKAIAIYARLLSFAPRNMEANYQSAVLLMQKGMYPASMQRLARLPAEAQLHSQALSVRCGDYAGMGRSDKAAKVVDEMLRSADLSEADAVSILPILKSRSNAPLAMKLLEGLILRHVASSDALRALGLLYEDAGRLDEARNVLDDAARLQVNSVPTLLELARIAQRQKDNTGALGYLAHAREIEPNNAAILFFWGILCIDQNLLEEAYASLKKAVTLDPNNAHYNYAMGVVTMKRVNAGESIPYLQRYCQLKPHDPLGRLALGAAYFNSAEKEQAQKVLSDLTSRDSRIASVANFYLARIADDQHRRSEAIQLVNRAIKSSPRYADAYAELGSIYLKERDYDRAEEALLGALNIDPNHFLGNLDLMVLYERTKSPKAQEQKRRFEQIKEEKDQQAKDFMRMIEIRP